MNIKIFGTSCAALATLTGTPSNAHFEHIIVDRGSETVSHEIFDRDTNIRLNDGAIVPVNTYIKWHRTATSSGQCDHNVLGTVSTTFRCTVKVAGGFIYPYKGGSFQPFHDTFGIDPVTGYTSCVTSISTYAAPYTPSEELLGFLGPYTFFADNLILVPHCGIPPDRISANPIRIKTIDAQPRRCPAGSALGGDPEGITFGNPCNALTGTKTEAEIDYVAPGFKLRRIYASDHHT